MEPGRPCSREATWIGWTRTHLTLEEMETEESLLSTYEREKLEDTGWLWIPGRVLWQDPSGALRRARFTHWTCFRTPEGEFEIDSAGQVQRLDDEFGNV